MNRRPRILIAAPAAGAQTLRAALTSEVECIVAAAFDEAVQRLEQEQYDAIVVGYYFDDAHPFRLISYAQGSRLHRFVPKILVKALGAPLEVRGESDIRSAYRELGIDDFLNFRDDADRIGIDAAQQRLREAVFCRLNSDTG